LRLYNRSSLPDEELRELAKFAARGVQDTEVLVEVTDTDNGGWSGKAWNIGTNKPAFYASNLPQKYIDRYWAKGKNSQYRYFILIRVPPEQHRERNRSFGQKWIQKKHSKEFIMETWQDNFITLVAHEFWHIWQYLRNKRLRTDGKKRKKVIEVDAEKYVVRIYNQWREKTGREPIQVVKLPNPFAKYNCSYTSFSKEEIPESPDSMGELVENIETYSEYGMI
jgi:hypothetical protein